MRTLWRLSAVSVILLLTTSAPAQTAPDLDGMYRCEGVNFDGSTYGAFVAIQQHGDVYNLAWTFDDNGGTGIGMGFVQGSTLVVIFQTESGGVGVASYAIEQTDEGLTLAGRWLAPQIGRVTTETLTKLLAVPASDPPAGPRV